MALRNNFYNELFEKEKYWSDLASKNLLNTYYLNGQGGIKEFYIKIRSELQTELEVYQNQILKCFVQMIDSILLEIESLTESYKNGVDIDINSLANLFISNQMNNNIKDRNNYIK